MLKTELPNYYTLLFKFIKKSAMILFYKEFNNRNIEIFDCERFIIKFVSKYSIQDNCELLDIDDIFNTYHNTFEKNKCAICLENQIEMKNNPEKQFPCIIIMLCGHSFDYDCI